MNPTPPPHGRRRATRREIVFAIVGWPVLAGVLWFVSAQWGWPGLMYTGLVLALLGGAALAVAAVRSVVRASGDAERGSALRVARGFGALARQNYRTPWQAWLVWLLLGVTVAVVLLAMATGDWRALAWAGLGLAGIVLVGMIGLFLPGREHRR